MDPAKTELVTFQVPADLEEEFEDFIVMGIAALDGLCGDRKDWTPNERAIVEWLEQDKHKV